MYKIVAFATLIVCAIAAPADDAAAQVTNINSQINADGSYAYLYETSNGINVQEAGTATGSVTGQVKYQSPEGEDISLTYVADDQGFQPSGSHVPTTPPLIVKALEYIRAHPPPPEKQSA